MRAFRPLVPLFALLLLAACGKPTSTPELQGAKSPAASASSAPAAKRLALRSATAAMHHGQLALTLAFNKRLAGTQSFDRLIEVTGPGGGTVDGAWALDEAGTTLRFPSIEANRTYHVRIGAGLIAASGETLGSAVARDIHSGPMQPSVGFASRGSVLPARETRGLPVVSVNVDQVDVRFMRVHDDALSDFFAAYRHNGRLSGWELDPDGSWWYSSHKGKPVTAIADPVYSHRFVLDGTPNQRSISYLPIQRIEQLDKPGLYFATMRRAGSYRDQYETSYFFVSDIGLHTRAYAHSLFVHTASLRDGTPLKGVTLQVRDGHGKVRVEGRTDDDGNALLAYTLDAADVLVARTGGDVSMLPFNQPALDLSAFAVAGRKQAPFDVFAWSGRDLYRPGETVHLSALLRDADGRPMKPQPLFATLLQPDGRTFASARIEPRDLGYYDFSREIPADAPTGRWQVEFRLDPAGKQSVQSFGFHVEDFLPERLKLALDAPDTPLQPSQPLPLQVQADYLYGAPASGNRFTAALTLVADPHPVKKLDDYFFGDPGVDLPKTSKDVIDTKLDAKGRLETPVKLFDAKPPKAPVAAILRGSVYETGGRTVTRTLKRTMWPAPALVGVRPLFSDKDGADPDARAGFELVRADADGRMLAGKGLKLTLQREHREFHWTYSDAEGWGYDYTSRLENVETRTLDAEAGRPVRFDVPVEWGNYRLEVTDPSTGLTMRYPFYAGWSWSDDNRGKEARPDKVKLALDKTGYRAGDTLHVTLTPPQPGPGVLLVESDHLLYARDIEAKAGASFAIPVTKDWERHDVYVTALVFRGGAATQHSTPARAVGEAFVPMRRDDRRIDVQLQAPDTMRPHQDLVAQVAAPALAGKKAYVTVSAVDVGVLNITRFPLPDPFAWFFGQRALGVDAYDLYGRIIEGFEGGTARLAYGGDMGLHALPQARRPTRDDKTVDLFSGPVELDSDGRAEVRLAMPEFNGTARVTALAWSGDRFGSAQRETLVRAPVVAELATPRVMAPGDRSRLNLDLSNFSGKAQDLDVRVESDAALQIGQPVRHVHLDDGGHTSLGFDLRAGEAFGNAHLGVRVRGDGVDVSRHHSLLVRAAWPATTRSQVQVFDTLAPFRLGTALANGLVPGSVRARLTLTALPPLPFGRALGQLMHYPYSCLEQTVSRGWAWLLATPELAGRLGVEAPDADARRERVQRALGRLAALQIPSGHFSMWGGDSAANTLLTPYAADFMLDARDAGFDVDPAVLQKTLQRLSDDLLGGGHPYYAYEHSAHLRFADEAYSGYVLARVHRAPLGTLRTLYDNHRKESLTALPLMHLGLALKLMGDTPRGDKAIAAAFAKKVDRPWYLGDYGSDLRDMALMVALAHKYDVARPAWDARLVDLARGQREREREGAEQARKWGFRFDQLSTQEEAALSRLAAQLLADGDGKLGGTLDIDGRSEPIGATALWSRALEMDDLRKGVQVDPNGAPPLYAIADVAGVPQQAPAADDHQVSVRRDYFTVDGKPWKGGDLTEGQTLIVRLRLEARVAMPDALLTDLLPGGLEVENFNLTDADQWADVVIDGIRVSDRGNAADVRHESFLDDRYVAALHLDRGAKAQVFYLVRAVTPGDYVVPPPQVEDMYRPEARGVGHSQPGHMRVVEPDTARGDAP